MERLVRIEEIRDELKEAIRKGEKTEVYWEKPLFRKGYTVLTFNGKSYAVDTSVEDIEREITGLKIEIAEEERKREEEERRRQEEKAKREEAKRERERKRKIDELFKLIAQSQYPDVYGAVISVSAKFSEEGLSRVSIYHFRKRVESKILTYWKLTGLYDRYKKMAEDGKAKGFFTLDDRGELKPLVSIRLIGYFLRKLGIVKGKFHKAMHYVSVWELDLEKAKEIDEILKNKEFEGFGGFIGWYVRVSQIEDEEYDEDDEA